MNSHDKRRLEHALRDEGFSRADAVAAVSIAARSLASGIETKSKEHFVSDDNAVLDAIEASNQEFAKFKMQYDAKFRDLETREAKMFNRPGNGGVNVEGGGGGSRTAKFEGPEAKAFSTYMRSGLETRELKALDITNPAEGGYALPKQISTMIESLMLLYSPMRKLSTVEQSQTLDYHKIIADPRVIGSAWVGEMAARPATNTPTFTDAAPPMGEIYANPQATQIMLDDVFFNAEQYLVDAVTQVFSSNEGNAFVNGTGINQPKGLLTYPTSAVGDATRPVGSLQYIPSGAAAGFLAPTATINPFDVLQSTMFSMKPQYRQFASWTMNSATLATLATVKDGQGRFILMPSQVPGFPPTLAGLPVLEDQFMPPIGAGNFPIALLSPRAYLIVDRIPIRMLRDPFSAKPFVGFYTTKRVGGGLLNSEACKLVKIAVS